MNKSHHRFFQRCFVLHVVSAKKLNFKQFGLATVARHSAELGKPLPGFLYISETRKDLQIF